MFGILCKLVFEKIFPEKYHSQIIYEITEDSAKLKLFDLNKTVAHGQKVRFK